MAMASATGLNGLAPIPPKICMPMTMARKVPITTSHQGAEAGITMASNRPIRAALPLPTVIGRLLA
jgi:hypothetical protein